jgi:hypothetical protein
MEDELKYEYHEGPEALQRFEAGMSRLFKTPKVSVKEKLTPKPKQGKASKD